MRFNLVVAWHVARHLHEVAVDLAEGEGWLFWLDWLGSLGLLRLWMYCLRTNYYQIVRLVLFQHLIYYICLRFRSIAATPDQMIAINVVVPHMTTPMRQTAIHLLRLQMVTVQKESRIVLLCSGNRGHLFLWIKFWFRFTPQTWCNRRSFQNGASILSRCNKSSQIHSCFTLPALYM